MRRRKLTSTERQAHEEREQFKDRNGVGFSEYHLWLPPRVSDWPLPPIVKGDKDDAMGDFHREFGACWRCGVNRGWDDGDWNKLELHHLAAGYSRGRSHERYLFVMLCADCHRNHTGENELGHLLLLKWRHDPEYTDWVRTALRLRRFLPELAPSARET